MDGRKELLVILKRTIERVAMTKGVTSDELALSACAMCGCAIPFSPTSPLALPVACATARSREPRAELPEYRALRNVANLALSGSSEAREIGISARCRVPIGAVAFSNTGVSSLRFAASPPSGRVDPHDLHYTNIAAVACASYTRCATLKSHPTSTGDATYGRAACRCCTASCSSGDVASGLSSVRIASHELRVAGSGSMLGCTLSCTVREVPGARSISTSASTATHYRAQQMRSALPEGGGALCGPRAGGMAAGTAVAADLVSGADSRRVKQALERRNTRLSASSTALAVRVSGGSGSGSANGGAYVSEASDPSAQSTGVSARAGAKTRGALDVALALVAFAVGRVAGASLAVLLQLLLVVRPSFLRK